MPEDAQATQLLDTEQQTSSATKKKKPSLATEQRYTKQLATWGESRATSNIVSNAHLAHCKMLRAAMMVFLASTNKASCSPISAPRRLLRVDDTVWRRPALDLKAAPFLHARAFGTASASSVTAAATAAPAESKAGSSDRSAAPDEGSKEPTATAKYLFRASLLLAAPPRKAPQPGASVGQGP